MRCDSPVIYLRDRRRTSGAVLCPDCAHQQLTAQRLALAAELRKLARALVELGDTRSGRGSRWFRIRLRAEADRVRDLARELTNRPTKEPG